jgi:hypothetical protein
VSSLDLPNCYIVFQVILLLAALVVECEWFVQPYMHFKWSALLVCLETKVAKFIASHI